MYVCVCMYVCMYVCTRWGLPAERGRERSRKASHAASSSENGAKIERKKWACMPDDVDRTVQRAHEKRKWAARCKGAMTEDGLQNHTKIARKIDENSSKNRRKSTQNRCQSALGRFWASKCVSGTLRNALGTTPGREKWPRKPSWQAATPSKSAQVASKTASGGARDGPGARGNADQERSKHHARSNTVSKHVFVVFGSSCDCVEP